MSGNATFDRRQGAEKLRALAVQAMGTMTPGQRNQTRRLLEEVEATANAARFLAEDQELRAAAESFEADMMPVRKAIIAALMAGDIEGLKGLKALLPHLLADVNESPALADLLAHQMGKALVEGLTAAPADGGKDL